MFNENDTRLSVYKALSDDLQSLQKYRRELQEESSVKLVQTLEKAPLLLQKWSFFMDQVAETVNIKPITVQNLHRQVELLGYDEMNKILNLTSGKEASADQAIQLLEAATVDARSENLLTPIKRALAPATAYANQVWTTPAELKRNDFRNLNKMKPGTVQLLSSFSTSQIPSEMLTKPALVSLDKDAGRKQWQNMTGDQMLLALHEKLTSADLASADYPLLHRLTALSQRSVRATKAKSDAIYDCVAACQQATEMDKCMLHCIADRPVYQKLRVSRPQHLHYFFANHKKFLNEGDNCYANRRGYIVRGHGNTYDPPLTPRGDVVTGIDVSQTPMHDHEYWTKIDQEIQTLQDRKMAALEKVQAAIDKQSNARNQIQTILLQVEAKTYTPDFALMLMKPHLKFIDRSTSKQITTLMHSMADITSQTPNQKPKRQSRKSKPRSRKKKVKMTKIEMET